MMPESLQTRRARPSQVKTDLVPQTQLIAMPPSAMSISSTSPSSQHGSPAQSVETIGTGITTSSSLQASPEALDVICSDKELDDLDQLVTPFQLPESISVKQHSEPTIAHRSRRTSTASLSQPSFKSSGTTAMGEAVKMSIVRRASNTVRKAAGLMNRRPSSTHPRSRDGSVGPGVIRRRGSMSNPNTPYETISTFDSESEHEVAVALEDRPGDDGTLQETGSIRSSTSSDGFGLIPLSLRQGMTLTKVSKKKSTKRITLYLDPDTAKIWWDRNKYIYIDDIKEIRTAEDIRQYRLDAALPESVEPRFFSLIYTLPGKANTKLLHLIADSDESFQQWVEALETISKHRQVFATSLMSFNDKAVRAYWGMEMERQLGKVRSAEDEHIDFAGVERVCRSLHIHVSTEELRKKFDMAKGRRDSSDDLPSSNKHGSRLNFDEFLEFVRLMKTRGDIRAVYQAYTNDIAGGMTKDEFLQFLREAQREDVDDDLATWESVFARFARKGRLRDTEKQGTSVEEGLTMSETAFAGFLTSTSNEAIPKEPQDYVLDRPMNEYYISSSHNTYLIGRQVASISSHEGYISALMRGCRCVEVDCWDGENNQPVVTHGHTLTTSISFLEVIKTINKYAFVKSRFPLWISLEVRCSPVTQINMAKIMIEVFGDKLVRAPLDPTSDRLPSPSELMDRILIKVKKPDESVRAAVDRPTGRRRGNSMPSPYQRALALEHVPVPIPSSPLLSPSPTSRSNRQINTITEGLVHEPVSSSPSECDSEGEAGAAKKANSKIHPILGELGVYCMGIHFDGFDSPDAKRFNHIFSFKEKTFAEKNQPGEGKRALYRHNMRYLMRVYPNGGRISSSNFDPLIYWKRGVQMAALNWQTFDTGMQLNQAMFDGGTAQSGYVLKPLEGRQIQVMPNLSPDECMGKRPRKKVAFTIEVISAQQLMRPFNLGEKRTLDPYVEVEVLMADDKRNKADAAAYAAAQQTQLKQRTKIVRDNGFNPEFNQTCAFDVTTKYPDLIFVRFSVKLADRGGYNDKAPFATYTVKLSNLKQGYRTIPLYNHKGERFLFSTLFCKIKKGPVADIMVSYQEDAPRNGGNKLKNIGRNVFANTSPKSSMDSSRTT
ncbi:PLC-like phosphodiesterase [Corynascus novoguineensis]|uniref:Phosphoinositide phospholipase C n=1 Tax=Corynascus novoguineensis TaxID=1126955 RepID=A0AAN7CXH7_9PEZI|nr:PLC-like phosphodiesterase [Corynascus novoguineensis]